MQTVRYYRDYAKRARQLNEGVDRRAMRETLEILAAGFEEIARALETGMVSAMHPEDRSHRSSHGEQSRATDGPARFLSRTRH